jgi:hypothetical protein
MAIFQRTLTATAAAATVFAALALPVWAQGPATPVAAATTSTAAEPAPAKAQAHHQHRGHESHGKRMAEKAAKLQAALQLTDAQQAGWTTFREALKPMPRKPFDRESFAKLTTPERIDQMRKMRSERNAQAERRAEATKAFYATLTPAQQKTFDAQTLHHGMHSGTHHGKHHAPAAPAK